MLLVFQVPFADARDFVSVDTYQLKKPDWLNINPDLRNDFIHKIGVVERNRNSKIDWTSSEVSCRAKKIFSFDEEAIKRLSRGNRGMVLHSRRLFPTEIREIGKDENGEIISFQNKAIGSMEIGFIHSSRKNFQQKPLSAEELSGIVKSCLNLKVDVKLKDKERISCRLYDITKYLGEIYLYATTKKTMRDKCCKWWVDVGAPMLVVMYRGSEVNEYPKDSKFIMNIKERKIRIYFGKIKIYKSIYIKAWYIVSYGDAKQRDVFENGDVSEEQVFNDIRTYNLNPVWRQNAKNMGDEWKKTITAERPVEYTSQELWVLKTIREYSQGNAKKPVENPQRKEMCPDWTDVS